MELIKWRWVWRCHESKVFGKQTSSKVCGEIKVWTVTELPAGNDEVSEWIVFRIGLRVLGFCFLQKADKKLAGCTSFQEARLLVVWQMTTWLGAWKENWWSLDQLRKRIHETHHEPRAILPLSVEFLTKAWRYIPTLSSGNSTLKLILRLLQGHYIIPHHTFDLTCWTNKVFQRQESHFVDSSGI